MTEQTANEIRMEFTATPENEEAIRQLMKEHEEAALVLECQVEAEARKAVDYAFHGLGKKKMNELYDFAEKLAVMAWNACYEYHRERIER